MIRRVASVLLLLFASSLGAQVIPNARWKTLKTEHFRVHFTPELEDQGRRAAANAERAWSLLSAELAVPRGPVDIVVADNVDFTNGYATTSPSNRIVIYAHPPVHDGGLRFYDDWSALIITHELTHIYHLDRTRGWWRVAQRIFGRDPLWFPNAYLPAWIIEGLAVYEESRLTGSGRLEGSAHRMIARASVLGGHLPRLDELSLGTSRFPGGGSVYAYGSLLIEFLARTHGEAGVRRFVDRTSAAPIPWLLNRQTRKGFGVTLEQAWRDWRDSLSRQLGADAPPLPGWRDLTPRGRYAFHPRWLGDSALVYVGSTGKDVASAYRLNLSGKSKRLGRRSAFDPNVPIPGGLLYSQLEYVSPYEIRSDLWIQRGGDEHRITRGLRLSYADARADGRIVAVQAVPGGTRLVTLTSEGTRITPLTVGSSDVQWAEPRWSPNGSLIAAVRRSRGATSSLVVLDTAGALVEIVREGAVIAGLSWAAERSIAYSSDRTGVTQVYVATFDASATAATVDVRSLTSVATGVFSPELSPDSRTLAAVHFRSSGYHVGVGPLAVGGDSVPSTALERDTIPVAGKAPGALSAYRPWRTLLPRYWRPVISAVDEELLVGGVTSGHDVIGRHGYIVQMQKHLERAELDGFALYSYSGLGMPLIDVSFSQDHQLACCIVDGTLRQRTQVASLNLTQRRPRIRTWSYVSVGASVELGDVTSEPSNLLSQLYPDFDPTSELRTVSLSGGWLNTRQRPELSISREDGIVLNGSASVRHLDGVPGRSHSAIGIAKGYRALDLGAWAHHVLAVRTAGGVADRQSTSGFSAGGTSGESFELLPGVATKGGYETFGVRGFLPGTLTGLRAVAVSAEVRAPLFAPSRGYRLIPIFFDRSSIALFAEGASAWCPERPSRRAFCRDRGPDRRAIASVGAEMSLDAALQYDVPYHFRVGVARPVLRRALAPNPASAYFTLGADF